MKGGFSFEWAGMCRVVLQSAARFLFYPLVLLALAAAASSCSRHEIRVPTPSVGPPKTCESLFCSVDLSYPLWAVTDPHLYVYKNERRLLVVDNKVLVRDYRVGLGPNPRGDKVLRGDGRTPEGDYYVCVKNPDSKYYKSLGLNYPLPRHAEEALSAGSITWEDYSRIMRAHEIKTLPPSNTSIGGAIFIHGGGSQEDWTQGCIALGNKEMEELFEAIPVGTPVKILP